MWAVSSATPPRSTRRGADEPVTSDPLYRKRFELDGREPARAIRAVGLACVWQRFVPPASDRDADASEPAQTLDRFAADHPGGRLALVLGNEGDGVSEATLGASDHRIRIPTSAAVDSLNVAVAAGIALARLTRFASV